MTIEEIKTIRATVLPTEQEYFNANSIEIVDTLMNRVAELEQQLADMTALYHSNTRCECGDDEACQHVRRIAELQDRLHDIAIDWQTSQGRINMQAAFLAGVATIFR